MLKPSVQVHDEGGVLLAEFWDCLRLDPAPVQELRRAYEDHLRRGGRPEVVVDLLGVGFAGSAALGGFLALNRMARPKGGRIIFCNVDPTVLEVFRVSKLQGMFTFAADRPAALALAAEPPGAGRDGTAPGGDGEGPSATGPAPLKRVKRRDSGA